MHFFRRTEAKPAMMTDEQVEIFAETMADVPSAITRAPSKLQERISDGEEGLRHARLAGVLVADELAKITFN
jgi:hypothetical protein